METNTETNSQPNGIDVAKPVESIDSFAAVKSDLQKRIESTTKLTVSRNGQYLIGDCPFPQHKIIRGDGTHRNGGSFSFYPDTDVWMCFSCPPNHTTVRGKAMCRGSRSEFEKLMAASIEPEIKPEPKIIAPIEEDEHKPKVRQNRVQCLARLIVTKLDAEQYELVEELLFKAIAEARNDRSKKAK